MLAHITLLIRVQTSRIKFWIAGDRPAARLSDGTQTFPGFSLEGRSILGRQFDMIDHQRPHRGLRPHQFQSQLLP
jgi:hypothetical protein